jgi:molybdopterin-guanine dinucleotide biosynthesis protein A
MTSQRVLGGVLVGGGSRRMGRLKQFIETAGGTLIERVVAALDPEVEEVVLLGGGAVPAGLAGFRRLPDADGCRGPIAGVLSALRSTSDASWVIAACDLPRVNSRAVRWLIDQRDPEAAAVFPYVGGYFEPLLAVYEPAARLPLETAVVDDEYSLQVLPTISEVVKAIPPPGLERCWFNANEPSDLADLEAE